MRLTNKNAKIYIAGHRGMVGSAVWRRLEQAGYTTLIGRTSSALDLRDPQATRAFFDAEQPAYVVLAAARVGGILANDQYPADFIGDNLAIQQSVITAAHETGVQRLLFLGSTCIYPKHAPQPMPEESLLTGPLEPTNQWYAVAKIAGIKLCQAYHRQHGDDFFSLMPTNLYGPNDNFDLETSHVLPALLRKFHEAKGAAPDGSDAPVTLWGSGTPQREFLHVGDLADAILFVLEHPEDTLRDAAPTASSTSASARTCPSTPSPPSSRTSSATMAPSPTTTPSRTAPPANWWTRRGWTNLDGTPKRRCGKAFSERMSGFESSTR